MQNLENNKKNFRAGVIYTLIGLAILSPLFYRSFDSFQNKNVVGPFFGICLGLTFFIAGVLRISKSRKVHTSHTEPNVTALQTNPHVKDASHSPDSDIPIKRKTPLFIKLVAISPAFPLLIVIIINLGCEYLGFGSFAACRGGSAFVNNLGYLGGLGWLVTLPIAGMLSIINSAFTSE